jgi:DNA-binding NarL/FixJ family response regulator
MGIKIFIAEDHKVVRRGLREFLQNEPDFTIAGEAEDGQQIIDLLLSGVEGDVLLTDLNMPGMDGIQLAKLVQEKYPALKVILLTVMEEEEHIQQAFQAGIMSYIFKTADPQELIYAVRQVADGKSYFCSGLSVKLMKRIAELDRDQSLKCTNIEFSERELDVLRLIADGFTNEEAADKLFTSRRTVEGHRQAMIDKTGSRNSLALIRFAVQHGLLK